MDTTAGEEPGSGTRPSSSATAPDGTIEPTGTAESVTSAQSAAGPAREPGEDPPGAGELGEAALSTTLHGLPSKVVPGSGWKNFAFRAINSSAKAIKSVDVYTLLAALDHSGRDRWHLLTLQWYDEDAGVWKTVDPNIGYLTTLAGLAPGEHTDIKLRMKVDAGMPVGDGFASALGGYLDEDDVHSVSEAMPYDFDIVVEESELPAPGEPGSEPQAPDNKPAPHGDRQELPTTGEPTANSTGKPGASGAGGGEVRPVAGRPDAADHAADRTVSNATLAETGSNSATGLLLGAGGASIALGATLATAARRRHRRTS
ncbi:hypothetical protein AB0B50_44345 [Streptomyces sp. NPDC041068]|uniref:hypothetical protein n=1 Tax=Streptomyces sp. NPDC041068 TaxID=3155130 RepID=UPI0033DB4C94